MKDHVASFPASTPGFLQSGGNNNNNNNNDINNLTQAVEDIHMG